MYPFLATKKPLPAFYIFHGDEDCAVNFHDSIELDTRITSLGGHSSLTIVAHAGHGDAKVWAAAASVGSALRSLFAHHG
jgi:predicted esterase